MEPRRSPTSSASPKGRGGRCSAMLAITKIRSRPWGSPTPSATPRKWPTQSTVASLTGTSMSISGPTPTGETRASCQCTSSRCRWPLSTPRHPTSPRFSRRSRVSPSTSTASSASSLPPFPSRSSWHPRTSSAFFLAADHPPLVRAVIMGCACGRGRPVGARRTPGAQARCCTSGSSGRASPGRYRGVGRPQPCFRPFSARRRSRPARPARSR